ncbi:anthranilate synthase component II [Taibaiella chishuiensis]|uniref:Anthranilate synthase component II n=1 Tax=Taibaiella chishuiensis TaxID=1434707 RepID=A0A2P8D5Q8_9BACT|nr:aminodeoxychorismate/anthranilate synthase component II [Taibaiella chishuiensis]PSK92554.1 anthranilate synthase component II [Taibaiella chishuiensis]
MKVLLVDNYDSFTYNLALLVKSITGSHPVVQRNDQLELDAIAQYDKIMLSPGPGLPEEAGLLLKVIERYAATKSILGVCLGHQAIAQVFGGGLANLSQVYHGVATPVAPCAGDPLFEGLGPVFDAGRYHSWVVSDTMFPDTLEVTARDSGGLIMALRHRQYDVRGVQFHPESILTPAGKTLLANWLSV